MSFIQSSFPVPDFNSESMKSESVLTPGTVLSPSGRKSNVCWPARLLLLLCWYPLRFWLGGGKGPTQTDSGIEPGFRLVEGVGIRGWVWGGQVLEVWPRTLPELRGGIPPCGTTWLGGPIEFCWKWWCPPMSGCELGDAADPDLLFKSNPVCFCPCAQFMPDSILPPPVEPRSPDPRSLCWLTAVLIRGWMFVTALVAKLWPLVPWNCGSLFWCNPPILPSLLLLNCCCCCWCSLSWPTRGWTQEPWWGSCPPEKVSLEVGIILEAWLFGRGQGMACRSLWSGLFFATGWEEVIPIESTNKY